MSALSDQTWQSYDFSVVPSENGSYGSRLADQAIRHRLILNLSSQPRDEIFQHTRGEILLLQALPSSCTFDVFASQNYVKRIRRRDVQR
jgi:hypothetical protein